MPSEYWLVTIFADDNEVLLYDITNWTDSQKDVVKRSHGVKGLYPTDGGIGETTDALLEVAREDGTPEEASLLWYTRNEGPVLVLNGPLYWTTIYYDWKTYEPG